MIQNQENNDEIIDNPLINYRDLVYNVDDTNIILTKDNIWKYFKYVYIISIKNDKNITSEIYNNRISKELLNKINKNFIIHRTSIKLLKNNNHFNNLIIMNSDYLEQFNIFDFELEKYNLVVPIINIKYHDLLIYLEQYEPINTLNNIFKLDTINSYFNKTINFSYLLDNLYECNFWTNILKININNKFKKKCITFNISRLSPDIGNIINEILYDKKFINNNSDYIKELEIDDKYYDNDRCNQYNYSIDNLSDDLINYENINQLFSNLNGRIRFKFFCNLLMCKKYCHLALNNYYILSTMIPEIKMYAQLFRYLISYVWLKFYLDEINKKYIKSDDNFIFDLDTASLLPVYPFIHQNPKLNPYMPILINDAILKPKYNIGGIEDYNISGICNTEEFKLRLNMFTSGFNNINIFENIDFSKYKIVITGSVMTACCQKNNIFNINNKNNLNDLDPSIYKYFQEYYSESDIDIMFKIKDTYSYITHVYEFFNDIKNSLKNSYTLFTDSDVNIILNKTNYLFVSEYFIINNIHFNDNNKNNNKIKYISENINSSEIKDIFRPFYDDLYNKKYKDLNKQNFSDISNNNDEFKIYINNYNNNIYTDSSYKYRIKSKFLKHDLELFNIKNDEFFGTVAKFHLPCVRAYYNGSKVLCTPSFISALLTKMNIDYRYMHGSQDPFHIINKNRMRGFGIWLNRHDIDMYILYNEKHPYWKTFFHDRLNNNLIGLLKLNHKLFKPLLNETNVNRYVELTLFPISYSHQFNNQYNQSISNLILHKFNSKIINNVNFDKLMAINENGDVINFKKNLINHIIDTYIVF